MLQILLVVTIAARELGQRMIRTRHHDWDGTTRWNYAAGVRCLFTANVSR